MNPRERFFIGSQRYTPSQLRAGERQGRWRLTFGDVYREGGEPLTELDRALAQLVALSAVAAGRLAALLLALDAGGAAVPDMIIDRGQSHKRPGVHRRRLPEKHIVTAQGFLCTDGWRTLVDLAPVVDDLVWEQALESALRMRLVTVAALEDALTDLSRARTPGVSRIRRVLALRPAGAPPTESMLETLAVQLIRTISELPPPVRQREIYDRHGNFVARVDLCWPELGIFLELDGEHHKGQPLHDARRESAIVAATGWLVARLTWTEVTRYPAATSRRLRDIAEQARRRPLRVV